MGELLASESESLSRLCRRVLSPAHTAARRTGAAVPITCLHYEKKSPERNWVLSGGSVPALPNRTGWKQAQDLHSRHSCFEAKGQKGL